MKTEIYPIGIVHSSLKDIENCPLQENESAPVATIEIFEKFSPGISDFKEGEHILILTWLHLADRKVLRTRPRNKTSAELTGVFSTRSPNRPNPIGIHLVKVISVTINIIMVSALEVLDKTPVIDIKPALRFQGLH